LNDARPASHLVLASASPRRAALLRSVGLTFTTRPVDVDESVVPGEAAAPYVERLARAKATALVRDGEVVIGADTTVVLDDTIIGKPIDADDARRILRTLSGRTHTVCTGVAVATTTRVASGVARTDVTFAVLPDPWIDRYVATGEPLDKAGAYGMQDGAALFVLGIAGSPSNVIGLPLHLLPQLGVVL
jgi:septum formation protein